MEIAVADVHRSPSEENKSPNLPQPSPNKSNSARSLNGCFVSIENNVLLNGNSSHSLSSPVKASPSKRGVEAGNHQDSPLQASHVGQFVQSSPATSALAKETTSKTPTKSQRTVADSMKSPAKHDSHGSLISHQPDMPVRKGQVASEPEAVSDPASQSQDSFSTAVEANVTDESFSTAVEVSINRDDVDSSHSRHSPRGKMINCRYAEEDVTKPGGKKSAEGSGAETGRKRKNTGTLDQFVTRKASKKDHPVSELTEGNFLLLLL
jgi:hypothetical protein